MNRCFVLYSSLPFHTLLFINPACILFFISLLFSHFVFPRFLLNTMETHRGAHYLFPCRTNIYPEYLNSERSFISGLTLCPSTWRGRDQIQLFLQNWQRKKSEVQRRVWCRQSALNITPTISICILQNVSLPLIFLFFFFLSWDAGKFFYILDWDSW